MIGEIIMEYSLLKSIHIFGVIILLGNIMITAWWKEAANRTYDAKIIAFAQRQVTLTDYIFTLPGAILIIAAGDYIAYVLMGDTWDTTWLVWGRILFIGAGIIWFFILIPIQIKQAKLAKKFAVSGIIPDEYWRLTLYWRIAGVVAVVLPLINIYWMVFKPS